VDMWSGGLWRKALKSGRVNKTIFPPFEVCLFAISDLLPGYNSDRSDTKLGS
jgi:hypothetical protein